MSPTHKAVNLIRSKSADNAKLGTLKGVDQSLVKRIMDEVLEESPSVKWDDIAGQEVLVMIIILVIILDMKPLFIA